MLTSQSSYQGKFLNDINADKIYLRLNHVDIFDFDSSASIQFRGFQISKPNINVLVLKIESFVRENTNVPSEKRKHRFRRREKWSQNNHNNNNNNKNKQAFELGDVHVGADILVWCSDIFPTRFVSNYAKVKVDPLSSGSGIFNLWFFHFFTIKIWNFNFQRTIFFKLCLKKINSFFLLRYKLVFIRNSF